MPIIFNWIGAGMGIASLVVGSLLGYLLFGFLSEEKQTMIFSLVSGSMGIALDIGYRDGHLFNPVAGGSIFFIPIWIIGIGFIICGLVAGANS
jgi:hypothetical protein